MAGPSALLQGRWRRWAALGQAGHCRWAAPWADGAEWDWRENGWESA